MQRAVFSCALAFVFVLFLGSFQTVPAGDGMEPTSDDLATFNQTIDNMENEILDDFEGHLQDPSDFTLSQTPIPMSKHFEVKKKSSSLTRAVRRAENEMKAQVNTWMRTLSSQGYIPVENPEPVANLDHKWGVDFPKFYVRLKLDLTVYCIKP